MAEALHKRILVVDDEEPIRTVCARMLERAGYAVETANSGDDALVLVEHHFFDLVLTDYRMPGLLNGVELGQAVRKQSPKTFLILMTAYPAIDTAVETLRMGANDYLIKPFDNAELLWCVQSCFNKRAAA